MAKIYNAQLCSCIELKIKKTLWKNQNGFPRNQSTTSQILTIHQILEGVRTKDLEATILFVNFSEAFDSIHRGKMEQILLTYGLSKETVAAIMMLYKNKVAKERSKRYPTQTITDTNNANDIVTSCKYTSPSQIPAT